MPVYAKHFLTGTHAQLPAALIVGRLYYCSTHGAFYRDNGASWVTCTVAAEAGAHAASHQPGGADAMAVDAAAGTGSLRTLGTGAQQACAGADARLSDARAPTAHTHPQSDVTNLVSDLAGKAAAGHTHAGTDIASGTVAAARLGSGSGGATKFLREDSTWQTVSGGSGAPFVCVPLLHHFTTLENTTSAAATWKIPAAATYGRCAAYLDMSKAGSPTSAVFVVCYTNTATTGTNRIGLRLGASPVEAGTTVTPIASSDVTMANSSTYPQTIVKALTVAELGSTAQWIQLALNLATSTVGPNIMSAAIILYY